MRLPVVIVIARLIVSIFVATLVMVLGLVASPALAADAAPIERAVADFLQARIKDLPGQASYSIGAIRADGLSDGCRHIAVAMDARAPAWGRTRVNVRCTDGAAWKLYVPVQIHVLADYFVSARALRPGQIITEADISLRRGDLANLPAGIVTDPNQVIGQSSRIALPAERPLRTDMLRQTLVVKQGQSVRIVSSGNGFQVSSDGRAQNNAAAGQLVQVRLASGQLVSGIARSDGTVDVSN